MKITVFGAGAIGSFFGGLLSEVHDVVLIGRTAHVDAILQNGLKISGLVDKFVYPDAQTTVSGLAEQDMVIVTVKAYDTEKAANEIESIVGERTNVLSIQNGLENIFILRAKYGNKVYACVTSIGVTFLEPGHIRFAGAGDAIVGSIDGSIHLAREIADIFTRCGITSRVTDNILGEIWLKAIVNTTINPITAIMSRSNSCILADQDLTELAKMVCQEALSVAAAENIALPTDDPFAQALNVARATGENISSMLQDIRKGKKTEIDEITGKIVSKAREHGFSVPANETLWRLIRALTKKGL
ncbi:MAG: 2-dehydropantoate 2-reductase [Methanomassiliicoccales archaeon]